MYYLLSVQGHVEEETKYVEGQPFSQMVKMAFAHEWRNNILVVGPTNTLLLIVSQFCSPRMASVVSACFVNQ